ncbi:MAG: metallophosphoesterase family protein [Chthoniobacteraceae bacterium]|nr:metallophosphoesterase family protein [Chthoniobacteraceae bacterium]
MRIAVISDTHNRLPLHLPREIAGADEIWHLGDVTDEGTLGPLRALGLPLHIVRGNGDWCTDWPWVADLEREGFRLRLIHIPPLMPPPGTDIVIHGHTHIPRNERICGTRFFCPGSVGKPSHGSPASYAWLELLKDRPPKWEVVKI